MRRNDKRSTGGGRVFVVVGAILVLLLAGGAAFLMSYASRVLPATIWIRGTAPMYDRSITTGDIRAESVDGPVLGDLVVVSKWGSPDDPRAQQGISLRYALTERERWVRRLAERGIVPRYRSYGAGFEETGAAVVEGGVTWREFRLFDTEFNCLEIGWRLP